jgi:hypothetical protein
MNTKTIFVNPDGMWWSSFEYKKHHREEYPNAEEFEVQDHENFDVDRAATDLLANALANYL